MSNELFLGLLKAKNPSRFKIFLQHMMDSLIYFSTMKTPCMSKAMGDSGFTAIFDKVARYLAELGG